VKKLSTATAIGRNAIRYGRARREQLPITPGVERILKRRVERRTAEITERLALRKGTVGACVCRRIARKNWEHGKGPRIMKGSGIKEEALHKKEKSGYTTHLTRPILRTGGRRGKGKHRKCRCESGGK